MWGLGPCLGLTSLVRPNSKKNIAALAEFAFVKDAQETRFEILTHFCVVLAQPFPNFSQAKIWIFQQNTANVIEISWPAGDYLVNYQILRRNKAHPNSIKINQRSAANGAALILRKGKDEVNTKA